MTSFSCLSRTYRSLVIVMLMMRVMVTIRTGRCARLSASWFTWVPTTSLAQNHSPPEVAAELPQFLRKRHRLIEIGQKPVECTSSRHQACSPFANLRCRRSALYHLLAVLVNAPQVTLCISFEVTGKAMKKVEPTPSADSNQTRPPCCSISSRLR